MNVIKLLKILKQHMLDIKNALKALTDLIKLVKLSCWAPVKEGILNSQLVGSNLFYQPIINIVKSIAIQHIDI